MKRKTLIVGVTFIALMALLAWRMVRPLNIFVVSEAFERPVDTTTAPAVLGNLKAETCGECHPMFYDEWRTSTHSRAWTDPYFQADWRFDGSKQVCKNCHIPLDRQQEHQVLGFRDDEKWDPILAPNPDFDPDLQHKGSHAPPAIYARARSSGLTAPRAMPTRWNGSPAGTRYAFAATWLAASVGTPFSAFLPAAR